MTVALASTLISVVAMAAAPNDGNALISKCKAALRVMDGKKIDVGDDQVAIGQCLGLVEGVRNTQIYLNSYLEKDLQICWPDAGINNGQAIRILVKYLDDHPAILHMDQTLLTMKAFDESYPCKH